ncbi:uncharacterized protein [Nicotiana tomentosiformis]|uniref:uncharacterized protein n=1 Tax=Nicotiana tomentosiformis TaxID=4098 RepID=UPI00388CE3CB
MSVTQSEMRFSELACHSIWLVPTDRERIRKFINGVTFHLQLLMTRERVYGSTFDEVVDIARHIEMFHHGRGRPFRDAQTTRPVHRGASSGHGAHSYQQGQSSFSALSAQSSSHAPSAQGYSGTRGSLQSPLPFAEKGCFECGDLGHIKRHCPHFLGGSSQQRSRPSTSALVTSPPAHPDRGGAQSARGHPRGGGRSGGGHARFYALLSRPDAIASDVVIAGCMRTECEFDGGVESGLPLERCYANEYKKGKKNNFKIHIRYFRVSVTIAVFMEGLFKMRQRRHNQLTKESKLEQKPKLGQEVPKGL